MGYNDPDFEKTNNELSFTFGNGLQDDRLIRNALEWLGTGSKSPVYGH